MPRAYSPDLRERVLAACEAGEGSQAEIARRFRVGERTLQRWLQAARGEGRRGPKVPARSRGLVGGAVAALARLVDERRTTPRWPSMPSGWRRARACGAALPRSAGG